MNTWQPIHSSARTVEAEKTPFFEVPLGSFEPCHVAIGSSISQNELAIGWEDKLGRSRDDRAEPSQLIMLPNHVFMRLYAASYSTDALSPLDLEFNYLDVIPNGLVVSQNPLLGPGGQKTIDITFTLHRPPRGWVVVNGVRRRATERDLLLDGGYEGDKVSRSGFKGVSCLGEQSVLKLGRWLAYRLSLPFSSFAQLEQTLFELQLIPTPKLAPNLPPSKATNYRYADKALLARRFPATLSNYSIMYLIDGLLSFGVIIDAQVNELLEALAQFENDNRVERILNSFFRQQRIWDIKAAIEEVKGTILSRPMRPPLPHMVYIAKAVITPTRVVLYPPDIQTSNYVLRRFSKQAAEGRFLRIQFWDEGSRLNMGYESKTDDADLMEGVIARYRRVLEYGLEVAGRKFVALDYSASQCRTHSFWAICEDKESGFTRKVIRDILGDYSDELVVAKHAARRGQLYATTYDAGNIGRIGQMSDFTHEKTGACYSDGCGIVKQDVVTKAALAMGLPEEIANHTSAAQIRLGGVKGVVVAWPIQPRNKDGTPKFPDIKWPSLRGNQIRVRPSMTKFRSAHSSLGIVKVSRFVPAYLNRESLTILYARGVGHANVMRRFLDQIDEIIGTENGILNGEGPKPYHARLFARCRLPVAEMLEAGLHKEPFLRKVVRLLMHRALYDLKWKARIYLEQGATLLGVVDELGVLKEGQVYCRTINDDGEEHVVRGKCIIYRAPVRHPGDIQIVEAVDHPALRAANLSNIILFNRQGPRDLPSCLSGGDCDGDEYTLIWDPAFCAIRDAQPMDYTPPKAVRAESVKAADVRAFHTTYMKNDALGSISNCHLALADMYGPEHPDCIELCMLHSRAVDFAKTGIPALLPKELKPAEFPDFMGPRRPGNVYQSQKPLGVMFRHPNLNPLPDLQPLTDVHLDSRWTDIDVPRRIVSFVERLKAAYDLEVRGLMRQFEAREEEVVVGVVLELPGGLKRLEKDAKLRDPLLNSYDALRLDFLEASKKYVDNLKAPADGPFNNWHLLAIAAVQYTHSQALLEPNPANRMLSFPWIYVDVLVVLANSIREEEERVKEEARQLERAKRRETETVLVLDAAKAAAKGKQRAESEDEEEESSEEETESGSEYEDSDEYTSSEEDDDDEEGSEDDEATSPEEDEEEQVIDAIDAYDKPMFAEEEYGDDDEFEPLDELPDVPLETLRAAAEANRIDDLPSAEDQAHAELSFGPARIDDPVTEDVDDEEADLDLQLRLQGIDVNEAEPPRIDDFEFGEDEPVAVPAPPPADEIEESLDVGVAEGEDTHENDENEKSEPDAQQH